MTENAPKVKTKRKEWDKKEKKKASRLLIEESGLSFGKGFILHPSPERTHRKHYFTIQLSHENYSSLVPRGLRGKKNKLLRMKNIFGKIFTEQEASRAQWALTVSFRSGSITNSKDPAPSEWQMQVPGPHLPTSSNDYVKCSMLRQVNGKRTAKMQREELLYLKLGRQKVKEQLPQK